METITTKRRSFPPKPQPGKPALKLEEELPPYYEEILAGRLFRTVIQWFMVPLTLILAIAGFFSFNAVSTINNITESVNKDKSRISEIVKQIETKQQQMESFLGTVQNLHDELQDGLEQLEKDRKSWDAFMKDGMQNVAERAGEAEGATRSLMATASDMYKTSLNDQRELQRIRFELKDDQQNTLRNIQRDQAASLATLTNDQKGIQAQLSKKLDPISDKVHSLEVLVYQRERKTITESSSYSVRITVDGRPVDFKLKANKMDSDGIDDFEVTVQGQSDPVSGPIDLKTGQSTQGFVYGGYIYVIRLLSIHAPKFADIFNIRASAEIEFSWQKL